MKQFKALFDMAGIFHSTFGFISRAKKDSAMFQTLKKEWAWDVLARFKVDLKISGDSVNQKTATIFIGNHISYLDIPLLVAANDQVSFVAKSEVNSWPVIGMGARILNTVFVVRGNGRSGLKARNAIKESLEQGKSIAVFPSGTTATSADKKWKKGIFEIAHDLKVPVQAFRIQYSPLRAVAYIDDDVLPIHMMKLFQQEKINASIEFHSPELIQDPLTDCERWRHWCWENP